MLFFKTKKPVLNETRNEAQDNVDLQIINKMNLVKRDEFDVLKKMVQKMIIENEKLKKNSKKPLIRKKKAIKKIKTTKK